MYKIKVVFYELVMEVEDHLEVHQEVVGWSKGQDDSYQYLVVWQTSIELNKRDLEILNC